RKNGSEREAFETIVASGARSAMPHGRASGKLLEAATSSPSTTAPDRGGYFSDITRTVAIGQPSDEMRHIYEVVKLANAAGRAAVKPGATGQDVDRATREVIEESGLGEYFTHRTGHGLGLEGHEPPYMVEGDTTPLQPGMTFTVEPGLYIPGKGGVRIEDNLVVTEMGGESLTTYSRDLIVVG
ncbi:MAG: M24 family metallopeptidase, partial [Anaerolineae bacterium]|nr:M24 family metallopeptidase [Anaerolineae bacterium]